MLSFFGWTFIIALKLHSAISEFFNFYLAASEYLDGEIVGRDDLFSVDFFNLISERRSLTTES